jgi:hypothetical protein
VHVHVTPLGTHHILFEVEVYKRGGVVHLVHASAPLGRRAPLLEDPLDGVEQALGVSGRAGVPAERTRRLRGGLYCRTLSAYLSPPSGGRKLEAEPKE